MGRLGQAIRLGPLYIILASLCLGVMATFVKLARQDLSTLEIIFWRGIVAVPLALGLAWPVGIRPNHWLLIGLRTVIGFGAMAMSFAALKGMSLADMSLIFRLEPLIVAASAPLVLGTGERMGWQTWILLGVGLSGCVIIIAPDLSLGSTWGLLGLGAAVAAGAAHLCLRPLGRTDDPRVVVLWFQAGVMVISGTAYVASTGHLVTFPTGSNLLWVLGVGVFATAAQLAMTAAYKVERAGVVAAANYTGPVWAVLLDLAVFSVFLSLTDVIGGVLVVGAGVLLLFAPGSLDPAGTSGLNTDVIKGDGLEGEARGGEDR